MGGRGGGVGPVGHAGGGFVYIAISSGLQSENTCMGQCREREQTGAVAAPRR